jgi:hypothetical protein
MGASIAASAAGTATVTMLTVAALMGDAVIIAVLNGLFNVTAIVLTTYVTYVTRGLDKERRERGE